jgi:hypothetical protein
MTSSVIISVYNQIKRSIIDMHQLRTVSYPVFLSAILLLAAACGGRKPAEQPVDTTEVKVDSAAVDSVEAKQMHEIETAEYRSQSLKGYQLYAVYPFEEEPAYLLIDAAGRGRILAVDDDKQVAQGLALKDDEFTAIVPLEQKENPTGITSFEKIRLVKKDGSSAEFLHIMVKRALEFGEVYTYQHGEATGDIKISLKENATMSFSARANTGNPDHHICELEGIMPYRANLAYYQAEPVGAMCKVLFLFNMKTVDVFTISGNIDCGCGANATLDGQYQQK